MAIDQLRYQNLLERFKRQNSIPNSPDKLNDQELGELIEAIKQDAATSGQRVARAKASKPAKTPPPPISQSSLDAFAQKMAELAAKRAKTNG